MWVTIGAIVWLLALAICLPAYEVGAAGTGIGAGVGANPVVLSQPVQSGGVYALPSLYVVNTGSIAATYRITLLRLPRQHGLNVPKPWVQIAPSEVRLAPGRSIMVGLKLSVPKRATNGRYESGLVATARLGQVGKSVATGAAAATALRFTVSGRMQPGSGFPFWVALLVGILVLAVGGFWLWHRQGYSIRVERSVRR